MSETRKRAAKFTARVAVLTNVTAMAWGITQPLPARWWVLAHAVVIALLWDDAAFVRPSPTPEGTP